jgi:hypothetical protein
MKKTVTGEKERREYEEDSDRREEDMKNTVAGEKRI